jgi:peptidyl-prolyl cis-trans isomerase D
MLRGLQKATANWLGRVVTGIILGLIAISFAVWGIGDVFRGFGRSTVASIGNTEITIEEFRRTYNDRLQQLARQIGRPLTPDQARALGFDRQLLGELLAEAAVDDHARRLRLGLSDEEIAKRIYSDPNFRGITGQFDRARFEQVIRQFGFTEARYVAEQRRVALRRQIVETVSGDIKVPQTVLDLRNRFENEERGIEYVRLAPAQAGDIAAPTPEELSKYFDANKFRYRAPEYRKLAVMVVTPEATARPAEVSDEEAKRHFEQNRSRFVTPERREVQQIVFPTMEEARAAKGRLAAGTTFQALADERGLKEQDVNLGLVAKSGIIDQAVADAAFALKQGDVSDAVQGRFGAVLVRVARIEPEKAQPFEQLAAGIKKDIATERARADVLQLHDKVEDARAGGLALSEVGKKLEVPVRTVEAVDRSGRDPAGKAIEDLPQASELISNAFASDVGVENDPLEVQGGFIWYDVVDVTPARERTLDEVRERVEQGWRDEQIAARLKAKADEIVEKMKGRDLAAVAGEYGLKRETAEKLKRGSPTPAVPANALAEVFRSARGEAANAEGVRATERLVFRVTDIAVPKLDPESEAVKQIATVLRRTMGEDMLAQYISQLEIDLGASVNQSALRTAVGGSAN